MYPGAGKIVQPPGSPAPASAPKASASILAAGQSSGGQQTIWPKPGNEKPLNDLYMCMTWKMNADFVGLQVANKLVFLAAQDFTFGKQGMNGFFDVHKRTEKYPDKNFQLLFGHNTGNLDNSHACAYDMGLVCFPNVSDTNLVPDTWYTVEAYVIASTCPTCKNGTVKWVDRWRAPRLVHEPELWRRHHQRVADQSHLGRRNEVWTPYKSREPQRARLYEGPNSLLRPRCLGVGAVDPLESRRLWCRSTLAAHIRRAHRLLGPRHAQVQH